MCSKYFVNDRSGYNTLLVYWKTILNAVLSFMEREYVLLYSNNQKVDWWLLNVQWLYWIYSFSKSTKSFFNAPEAWSSPTMTHDRIPALSKGQPSNSEPLIDWCLTSTAELVHLDCGCLHKKSDTLVLIRITTPLKGRHSYSGTQYHIEIY
jgi:hypothetical protein